MKPTDSQEKALDMDNSVCVTASAGTGKTFILTQRYIKSLHKNYDPSKILALTYTDKAAAEMREKIEREIRAESLNDDKLKVVLENIHKCSISTFHGFCASLLKEFPIEAGVEPGFSIMDELDKSELIETTINDILKNPPEFLREDVIHLYLHVKGKTIKKGVYALLGKWEEFSGWFEKLKDSPSEVVSDWRDAFTSKINQSLDLILNDDDITELMSLLGKIENPNRVIKSRLELYYKLKNASDIFSSAEILSEFKPLTEAVIKKYPEISELAKHYNDTLKKIWVYSPILFENENPDFVLSILNAFGDVTKYIHDKISFEKERASVLDFNDLVRFTSNLMDKTEVVETLRERYDYILVDEVQDNDPILTGIVKKICGDSNDGRLFIVGDMKQSIYGFRGSDPNGFLEMMETFPKTVSLDKSFRTVPEIITSVNKIFSEIFDGTKIEYQSIDPSRENESGTVTVLKNITEKTKADEDAKKESELIASWIKDNVGKLTVYEKEKIRPSKFSDIAILLRTRTKIDILKRALEKYNVPYFEYKGKDFYKSQEIYDIVNVLKAVAFPEDDVSLYGALRSPYLGISDETLCRCSAENTSKPLVSRLEESEEPEILSALETLKSFKKISHEMTLVRFVNEVIRRCGILSVYSGLPSGSDEIANLEKFVDMVSSKTVGASVSLPAFLKTVDTCIEEEISEESSSGEDESDGSDRVKILTIHASKGLEYPIVILAFAANEKSSKADTICFDEKLGASLTLKLPDGKKIPSFVYECTKDIMKKREGEEGRRLYYVGLTRARDHLVISETETEKISETSFIGMHEITDAKIISECCCEPEKIDEFIISKPLNWQEISPLTDEIRSDKPEKIDADEYLLAKGSCIHEIFAGADISETAKRYGLLNCVEEFSKDLERFMNCELMADVIESRCELPVSIGDENKRIDRLVKYKDGSYAIIDYKLSRNDDLMEKYTAQLSRYSELMTKILGQNVPAYLYFVGGKEGGQIVKTESKPSI